MASFMYAGRITNIKESLHQTGHRTETSCLILLSFLDLGSLSALLIYWQDLKKTYYNFFSEPIPSGHKLSPDRLSSLLHYDIMPAC